MKKKFKGLLLVVMIGMAGVLGACGSDEASGDGDKAKKLVVGTDAAFAPFEYMNKGEVVGFDIDFLDAVMEEAGYEYDVKNIGWDPLFAAVQGGKEVDMGISGITINDERKQTYDFSNPYFESTHMIMFGEDVDIKSANDLKGLKIGVQNGTTGQEAAEKIVGKNSSAISKYENNVVAITALKQGQVDAVVTDNTVVNEYVKNNPQDNFNTLEDPENFESEFYGLMFPKDSDLKAEFDKAIKAVIESGKYAEIYKEWFGKDPNTDTLLEQAE
ncbi:basic amino acid ABC transporter substrate-binding protein [Bacillus sp. KH172YL63]|uniref:basic amino acid ABC transporter substrate-binding protein n=1 Tax=Bacillus sp. KH172YL63 TaxID=2709784 RepID=UPI0013E44A21|nr:basic amino acid ABC transporter substrate-binding protein [Bacillus sp. KH172YL63]BCB02253.1 basic amino acid ABC transporter substrate-binding protein [Bacillus sp. KH172YL63]